MKRNLFCLLFALVSIVSTSFAQQEVAPVDSSSTTEQPKNDDLELGVEQQIELKVKLDSVERLYSAQLNSKPKPKVKREQQYEVNEYPLTVEPLHPKIKIYTIKPESPIKPYPSFVKLGYGNYGSPLADIYINNKPNGKYQWGVRYNHKSSRTGTVDGKNSGYGTNEVSANGAYLKGSKTFSGALSYVFDRFNYYGYSDQGVVPESSDIKQKYNTLAANVGVQNQSLDNKISYKSNLGFRSTSNDYEASETDIFLHFDGGYTIDSTSLIDLKFNASVLQYKDAAFERNRNFVSFAPSYVSRNSPLSYTLGIKLDYENDTLNESSDVHFYPRAELKYVLDDVGLLLFTGVSGGMEKNDFFQTYKENPYLDSNLYINHTNNTIDLYIGAEKVFFEKLLLRTQLSYLDYKNLGFYVNTGADLDRFSIAYAKAASIVRFRLEGTYSSSSRLTSGFKLDFMGYDVDFDGALPNEAYHKPNVHLTLNSYYKLSKRVHIGMDFYYIGGIKAYDFASQSVVKLDGIPDLNLHGKYFFNRRAGLFLDINNVFSKKYQRYYRYQNQGINFIGGFTYAF